MKPSAPLGLPQTEGALGMCNAVIQYLRTTGK